MNPHRPSCPKYRGWSSHRICTCGADVPLADWEVALLNPQTEDTMLVVVTHKDGTTSEFDTIKVAEVGESIKVNGDTITFEEDKFPNPRLYTVLNVQSFYTLGE